MTGDERQVAAERGGAGDRLLSWDRVQDVVGISRPTAWRMQQRGDFPRPVKISPGRVGWWESDLTAWKSSRGRKGEAPVRQPPRAPRLQGMPRTTTKGRPDAHQKVASPAPSQTTLAVEQRPVTSATVRKPPRKSPSVDQIDFGF
jgi:prophage regulatory protein